MPGNQKPKPAVHEVLPWYRQFWPWFLIVLPGSVVLASFFMLYLAIRHADTLVSDNYYRDGLAVNQVLFQDVTAQQLGLSAKIDFLFNTEILAVDFKGDESQLTSQPEVLSLFLMHPTDADADHTVLVYSKGNGFYEGKLPAVQKHRYYLRLLPGNISKIEKAKSKKWRLNGEIDLGDTNHVELGETVGSQPPA